MPDQTPAAWYPDPFRRHDRRYWDGSQWTHHVATQGRQEIDPPEVRVPPPAERVSQAAAGWYPDPFGRHERRYWDGTQWTQHVSTQGRPAVDPPISTAALPSTNPAPEPTANRASRKIQHQVRMSGVPNRAQTGHEALFTEPVLVVNQKSKIFGLNAEYAVFDQQGRQIGAVREVGQRAIKKAMGAGGSHGTHRFEIVNPSGMVLIGLTRPAMVLKSKMSVVGANGTQGEIVQKTLGVLGKVRFDLESGGRTLGSINAADWQEWDFSIRDASGAEVARITKTWAGWAKERFTKADNYVVQIHRTLEEPLRSLVVAAALAVDTALKQGRQVRGSSLMGTRRYE